MSYNKEQKYKSYYLFVNSILLAIFFNINYTILNIGDIEFNI